MEVVKQLCIQSKKDFLTRYSAMHQRPPWEVRTPLPLEVGHEQVGRHPRDVGYSHQIRRLGKVAGMLIELSSGKSPQKEGVSGKAICRHPEATITNKFAVVLFLSDTFFYGLGQLAFSCLYGLRSILSPNNVATQQSGPAPVSGICQYTEQRLLPHVSSNQKTVSIPFFPNIL